MSLLSGVQRFQQRAALGRTVPAEHNVHGCCRQRRAEETSARSRWPAAGRQKLGVTVASQNISHGAVDTTTQICFPCPLRDHSAHAAAAFLPRSRPAARALQRAAVTPSPPPSESGFRGTSERRVTGTAEKPAASRRAPGDQQLCLGTALASDYLPPTHLPPGIPPHLHVHTHTLLPHLLCNGAATSRLIR